MLGAGGVLFAHAVQFNATHTFPDHRAATTKWQKLLPDHA
jgi:hypothetical protein